MMKVTHETTYTRFRKLGFQYVEKSQVRKEGISLVAIDVHAKYNHEMSSFLSHAALSTYIEN